LCSFFVFSFQVVAGKRLAGGIMGLMDGLMFFVGGGEHLIRLAYGNPPSPTGEGFRNGCFV